MSNFKRTAKRPTESKYKDEKLKLININKDELNNYNVIGVDESGVGDYLTPIVAAAVYVPIEKIQLLKDLGVDDSKKINDSKIQILAKKIKEEFKYSISYFSQEGYNKLSRRLNANEIKMFLHLKCVNFVENNKEVKKVDFIVIDKYSTENSISDYYCSFMQNTYLKTFPFKNSVVLLEKAESFSLAVAAASILARNYLLEMCKSQNEDLEITLPLGASDEANNAAIEFVNKYGFKNLFQVAKINFANTEKVKMATLLNDVQKVEYEKILSNIQVNYPNIFFAEWDLENENQETFLSSKLSDDFTLKIKKTTYQKTTPNGSIKISLYSKNEPNIEIASKNAKVSGFKKA